MGSKNECAGVRIAGGVAWWLSVLVAGCSAADATLVEYPPTSNPPTEADEREARREGGAFAPDAGPSPDKSGKKIANGSIFLRGVTTDAALVFEQNRDLMVWPYGAPSPVRLVQDFAVEDALLVRGRLVAAWLGDDLLPSPPTIWAKTGGVQTLSSKVQREALYPKPGSDDFAYLAPSTLTTRRDVWTTRAGGGAHTQIVGGLHIGYPEQQCRYSIAYVASGLLVAGCPGGTTTPSVAVHALDGSSAVTTILEGSAPSVFLNRARTHAVVQTSTASSIRSLSGVGSPLPLDVPVRQAVFSSDDARVLYLDTDGKVKRASTTVSAPPELIAPSALAIASASPDLRFVVVATNGDVAKNRIGIAAIDANAPATPRTLVAANGSFVGVSERGDRVVYREVDTPSALTPSALWVASLPEGDPRKLSSASSRALVVDDVVYWQEPVAAKKSNVLKAARLSTPETIITVAENLDALTSLVTVVNGKVFVASALGLWEFPAPSPGG